MRGLREGKGNYKQKEEYESPSFCTQKLGLLCVEATYTE